MVSEQVMEAFCMEPWEAKVKSLASEQQMFKEMQQMLVVMLARLDQYLGNPTRLDQTVSNQIFVTASVYIFIHNCMMLMTSFWALSL